MNESYIKIFDSCQKFFEISKSEKINESILWARSAIEEKHIPTAIIAEMGLDVKSLIRFASTYFETDLLKELEMKLPRTRMCITLEKGNEFALYRVTPEGTEAISIDSIEESIGILELIITLPSEKLDNAKLMLTIGVDSLSFWKPIVDEADIICLRTNATMAMTLSEKEWMKEIVAKRFGVNNFGIWIDKIDILNDSDEIDGVVESVDIVLSKSNLSAKCLFSMQEAIDYISPLNDNKVFSSLRSKRILQNLLSDCNDEICLLLNSKFNDSSNVAKAISELESTRKRIEIAGQIASRTIFANAMSELCIQVKDSARNYNTQISNNILDKINNTNDKELESVVDQIEVYITRVWSYFSKELSNRTKKDIGAIFDKIVARMEEDAGALYALLDEDTIKIIQDSFELADNDSLDLGVVSSFGSDIDVTNPVEKLKKRTRTAMLLSIPLVIVNPYLGIASFTGSGLAGGLSRKSALAEYKSQIIGQVNSICGGVLADVLGRIETGFDNAIKQSSDNITKAYNGIVDILVQQIKDMQENQIELNQRRSSLETVINDTIPALLQSI